MKTYSQTTHCTTCNDQMTIEVEAYDNLGTLVEEMSVKDGRAQDRFLADHQGHDIYQTNEEK